VGGWWGVGVGGGADVTRSCAPSFVWCNAKLFYCFSPWEKAALCF